MNGFSSIEVLIALSLLSILACATTQYFVWMNQRARANFLTSRAVVQKYQPSQRGAGQQFSPDEYG